MDEDDDVMSPVEAAEVLRVSKFTVRRLFDAGELTGWKTKAGPGGHRKISRASVEAYRRRQLGDLDAAGR